MRGMDRDTGKLIEGRDHIVQSIKIILSTPINTRVMRPEFGSAVPNLISAPMTDANRLRLYAAATEAINTWEPRIEITNISVIDQSADGDIYIRIEGRYAAEDFSIPSLKVGVAMRDDTFWIEALEVVDPSLKDKVPLADASDGFKDKAALLSKILELIPGASWTIYTDETLSGTGTDDKDVLRVAIPLTQTEKTKIASIDTGAQVNPRHQMKWSALDSDTGADGTGLLDGSIGFYKGSLLYSSTGYDGGIAAGDTIFIAKKAATFNQDASNPNTDLDAVNLESLFGDITTNGGSILLRIGNRVNSDSVMVRGDTISEVKNGSTLLGWEITDLKWHQDYNPGSAGTSWNITGVLQLGATFAADIADLQVGGVEILVNAVSTTFTNKQWRAIDLGAGKDYTAYDLIEVSYQYDPNNSIQRASTHFYSSAAITALPVNAISGSNWYANGQRGIDKMDGNLTKVIVGKRASVQFLSMALDRSDSENTTITLTVRGYKL